MTIIHLPCGCQVWDRITVVQCYQHATITT